MLVRVAANSVGRRKGFKEMIIEASRSHGGVSEAAGEGGGLLVDQSVITSAIIRLEDLLKMIDHQFVVEFREAT